MHPAVIWIHNNLVQLVFIYNSLSASRWIQVVLLLRKSLMDPLDLGGTLGCAHTLFIKTSGLLLQLQLFFYNSDTATGIVTKSEQPRVPTSLDHGVIKHIVG